MLTAISALIVIVLMVTDDTSSIEHSCVVSIKKVYLNHADCTVSQCCMLTVLCHSAACCLYCVTVLHVDCTVSQCCMLSVLCHSAAC